MQQPVLTRKKISALLQADLEQESFDLLVAQLASNPSSFTQHHMEIAYVRFIQTRSEFYLTLMESLFAQNGSLTLKAEFDFSQDLSDPLTFRLLCLVLKCASLDVPVQLQQSLLSACPDIAEFVPNLDISILNSCPLYIQLANVSKFTETQKLQILEASVLSLQQTQDDKLTKSLVDLHDQLTYSFIPKDAFENILKVQNPEVALGLATNCTIQGVGAEMHELFVNAAKHFIGTTPHPAVNLLCALNESGLLESAILLEDQAAVLTAVVYFRERLTKTMQQIDSGEVVLNKELNDYLFRIYGLLNKKAHENMSQLSKSLALEIAYTFMEGLSIPQLSHILKQNLGLIEDLAMFLDCFQDEEWTADWAGWSQFIQSWMV
ncbi:Conserved_hypothetical protein [Hexamita inflata]|uniref:Uncharacterized protein n=1 Tax=Hexamita inflata TaxID=28002 RepID=A0AA86QPB1_9EUKA|nr:Conserved hypothetical protein [Hexamita inflata]